MIYDNVFQNDHISPAVRHVNGMSVDMKHDKYPVFHVCRNNIRLCKSKSYVVSRVSRNDARTFTFVETLYDNIIRNKRKIRYCNSAYNML